MNPVHLHLLLNHVPVLGTIFGLILLTAGVLRHSGELKTAAMVVLVVSALVAVPVLLSGESAEEIAETLPAVTEAVVEPHESAATLATIALGVTGALALLALILGRGSVGPARPLTMLVLVLALVSAGLMARTANLGGMIRHTEIRADVAVFNTPGEPEDDD